MDKACRFGGLFERIFSSSVDKHNIRIDSYLQKEISQMFRLVAWSDYSGMI
jgi:hypothetical protein